jgi:hypothetical protein
MIGAAHPEAIMEKKSGIADDPCAPSRREFLKSAGGAGAAALAGGGAAATVLGTRSAEAAAAKGVSEQRSVTAYQIRMDAARTQRVLPAVSHVANGDETRYASRIGNFSKGLPHDGLGQVEPSAYDALLRALGSGRPADFEAIPMSGSAKLTNPQSGLAFEMISPDSHTLAVPPAPAFASAEEAGEIVENFWMALLRDVPFSEYGASSDAGAASADLSSMSDFRGPKSGGAVTPATLFRGSAPGCLTGPYVSQFFWLDTPYGAERVDRQIRTGLPGVDFLTSYSDWLAVQNGLVPASGPTDPVRRYVRNGRDLATWVHNDVLFQAYFNALLVLFHIGAPADAGNPYASSSTQIGFGTFGPPHFASVLAAIAKPALEAVWYQKWFVHRRLRPEAFAGAVHNRVTNAAAYPVHGDALHSAAVSRLLSANGTALLPIAFAEGSPTHPAYGAGHATVAGACVTLLKAFFDESFVIPNPVEAAPDGVSLVPYAGPALTVGGELDKLAANVAIGRNIAGVHWRSDATESLKLGEAIAIRYLGEAKACFNEDFAGFSLTKFDGTTVTV